MKKSEKIFVVVALFALLLKLFRIPGNSVFLILSLSLLSIVYYFGFLLFNNIRLRDIFKKSSYANTSQKKIVGSVALGFALAAIVSGILFKLQIWPGGDNMLLSGLTFLALILTIAIISNQFKKSDFFRRIYYRGFIIGSLGILILFTPTTTLIDIYFRHDKEYGEKMKETLENPYDQKLQQELQELRENKK